MAHGSLFHYIESLWHLTSFRSTILQSFTFRSINQKYQKYLLYRLSVSVRSHFCKWPWRDWQPLYRVGCKLLIICTCIRRLVCCLLLDWYLGSQNWGKYLRYFAASPFPLQGKTNATSRGSMYQTTKNIIQHCILNASAYLIVLSSNRIIKQANICKHNSNLSKQDCRCTRVGVP